jgi:hypothetical protein
MAATRQPLSIDRIQTFKEWLKFARNGAILALVMGLILFWNSPHTADEISVAIAIPLIIFNCIPFLVRGLAATIADSIPSSPQEPLPFKTEPTIDLNALPRQRRMQIAIIAGAVVFMIVCLFAGCAIFLASFSYSYFDVAWAVIPARRLAYIMFAITAIPVAGVLGFVAGMAYTGKILDSAIALVIYLRTIRPLAHWPTYA